MVIASLSLLLFSLARLLLALSQKREEPSRALRERADKKKGEFRAQVVSDSSSLERESKK